MEQITKAERGETTLHDKTRYRDPRQSGNAEANVSLKLPNCGLWEWLLDHLKFVLKEIIHVIPVSLFYYLRLLYLC